jgi:hypothetical protein
MPLLLIVPQFQEHTTCSLSMALKTSSLDLIFGLIIVLSRQAVILSPAPFLQTEQLLYVVDLLLSNGQPVLLAGEIATGKSAFVEVLVKPNYPVIHSPIHPALNSTHLRHLLSRGVHGQTQASSIPGHHQDSKGSILFLMEDLHLATFGEELGGEMKGKVLSSHTKSMAICINSNRCLQIKMMPNKSNYCLITCSLKASPTISLL